MPGEVQHHPGAGGLPRDAVTKRIVEQVKAGTGSWGRKRQADLLEGLRPREGARDADGDGMLDAWETVHGLDAKNSSDHFKTMPSGYTAIEDYCNESAGQLIAEARRR
jgi:hypothetical protein